MKMNNKANKRMFITGRKRIIYDIARIAIGLAIVGIGFILLPFPGAFVQQHRARALGGRTTATVTMHIGTGEGTTYHIRFRANETLRGGTVHYGRATVFLWNDTRIVGRDFLRNKMIIVYYSPENPDNFIISQHVSIWWIITGIGMSVALPVCALLYFIKQTIKEYWLRKTGRVIVADIVNVAMENEKAFKIFCKWKSPKNNKEYTFHTGEFLLYCNPSPLIHTGKIKTLTVYVAPHNANKYFIEMDELVAELKKFYME